MQLIDKADLYKTKTAQKSSDTADDPDKASKLRIAKQMLDSNANISFIMQVTGLSEEEIKACR